VKKTAAPLLIIFLIALGARLAYVASISPQYLSPDSGDWNRLALGLLGGSGYDSTFRGPVYPLFLAGIYALFGFSVAAARVFQALAGAATAIIIFFIANEIFSKRAALIAAAVVALYPYLIYFSGDILSETLFTFLISLCVYFLLVNFRKNNYVLSAVYGGVSGITLLCKGTFLPFYAISLALILFLPGPDRPKKIKMAGLALAFTALIVLPWTARNYRSYHKFVLLGLSGQSLWLANNPQAFKLQALPETNQDRLDENFTWFDEAKYKEILSLPPVQADERFRKEAREFIFANPGQFVSLSFKRLVHFWRPFPVVATNRNKLIALLTSGLLLPLGLLGVILSLKKYWKKTLALLALLGSFTLIHMVFTSSIRYRVPLDPYFIIFASFTISLVVSSVSRKLEFGNAEKE
jgi:4-amino-4-deoxy-L-arabinose transferase-like glycosyltransferase